MSVVAVRFISAPELSVKSVPLPEIFSPESANCNSFPEATSMAETSPSTLNTSVEEPPSFTLNMMSLSETPDSTIK